MQDAFIQNGHSSMPLIGETAPEFVANTTNGTVNFPADYMGRWVVFFSHPSDFTPVCTTEFMAFQAAIDEFRALNTELIGLSVGTLSGHLAWLDAIKAIDWNGMRDINITFPLIDDIGMHISRLYGMIHPGASATHSVRAVFIIDPHGIIRTIIYYPPSVGRNTDEIKRVLVALQTSDEFSVSTPVNWVPGDEVVVPSPSTMSGVVARNNDKNPDLNVRAWFLAFKKLDKNTIFGKIFKKKSNAKS